MKKILLATLVVILAFCGQACKKKEESNPTQVLQIENVILKDAEVTDLTDGTSYNGPDALANLGKIDLNYKKAVRVRDSVLRGMLASADLSFVGDTTFPNVSTFVPLSGSTSLSAVTDSTQLRTLYDQSFASYDRSLPNSFFDFKIYAGMPVNSVVMFKIRSNTNNPKYGGILFNSFSADSLSANVSITVQR